MEKNDKRRYSLFSKSLKSCVDPLVRPVLKQQGIAASKLMIEWQHIVGKELASHTLPSRLTFPKDKNSEGTLVIACDGARALELQHMQPVIMERIASYFGYKAVARIIIEQRTVATAKPVVKPPRKTTPRTLDTACIAQVEDAELKSALSALAKTFSGHTLPNE